MDLPVVFVLDRAGIVPDDGPTHQGVNDIAYMRHMPNMIVMAPKDENELQHMLWSAISYGHPCSVRFPKAKGLGVPIDESSGSCRSARASSSGTAATSSSPSATWSAPALEAAKELEKDGLSFAVVNARFVKPLDRDMILRFAGPGRTVVTLEEGIVEGGAGSAVRELLDREGRFGVRFMALGVPVGVHPVGKSDEIRAKVGLDVPGIVRRIRDLSKTPLSCGADERTRG